MNKIKEKLKKIFFTAMLMRRKIRSRLFSLTRIIAKSAQLRTGAMSSSLTVDILTHIALSFSIIHLNLRRLITRISPTGVNSGRRFFQRNRSVSRSTSPRLFRYLRLYLSFLHWRILRITEQCQKTRPRWATIRLFI